MLEIFWSRVIKPRFSDFLSFVKQRARLVDNEFGRDISGNSLKERDGKEKKGRLGVAAFATGIELNALKETGNELKPQDCVICSAKHGVWKSENCKGLSYKERREIVQIHKLCNKCLRAGHFA